MSSMLGWDSSVLRAPTLPWVPLHHRLIKQEPMEPSMVNGFLSSHSEGFHSASPSSSSHDSSPQSPRSESPSSPPRTQPSQNFRPLTPPGFEASPVNQNRMSSTAQSMAAVTPPKSPSPLPPWANNSDGVPSPEGSNGDGDEEPGLRIPAVNSHGKVKTFKCKQCEFVAVTKLDFWDHTKSHIKPERMLNCPKCPFVTEYKHHLEYHMRNHFGSKPFQCSQCSYSCVNKSMLNSHLKSHSNIYQYRCSDCNYATKYCHSLKLHLRKYQHQPAMVLNQDGTPNPLPIIDVYGTRRGPKQRSGKNHEENNLGLNNNNMMPSHTHSLFPNPFGMNFPYGSLLQHPMFAHNNNLSEPGILSKSMDDLKSPQDEDNNNKMRGIQDIPPHLMMQPRFMQDYTQVSPNFVPCITMQSPERPSPRTSPYSPHLNSVHVSSPHISPPMDTQPDALDLTSSSMKHDSPPIINSPIVQTAAIKNRRKGRAFKLERSVPRVEQAEDRLSEILTPEVTLGSDKEGEPMEIKVDVQSQLYESIKDKYESEKEAKNSVYRFTATEVKNNTPPPKTSSDSYNCPHCDIVFKDIIMYTMHMGYHGYKDPFTCNMCGEKSFDRVSFFVHIARSQHS